MCPSSLLTSLYRKHNVVEVFVRISIVAVVAEAALYFLYNHSRAIVKTINRTHLLTPNIPDMNMAVPCEAKKFNGLIWFSEP